MWQKLSSLNSDCLAVLPIDCCRDFETHPDCQPISLEINLSLSRWRDILRLKIPQELKEQILAIPALNELESYFVESTTIHCITYERATEKLLIDFVNGSSYRYFNVSYETFYDLHHAPSKGRYFNIYIKNRYSYQRIS